MPTTPEQIQGGLQLVTVAAVAEVRSAAAEETTTTAQRAALFAATPLIVSTFSEGAAALALDWYDELRELAGVVSMFSGEPVVDVPDDLLRQQIAKATREMWLVEQDLEAATVELAKVIDLDAARISREMAEELAAEVALTRLDSIVEKQIADSLRETVTENAKADPEAQGWRRALQGDGDCVFCRFLADKGAIYKAGTARFAAHPNCDCVAMPVFNGEDGPEASVFQYVASQRVRTPAEQQRLREYLAKKYPGSFGGTPRGSTTKRSDPVAFDDTRSVEQLRQTLADLERSLARFDSPGTRARIEELRRQIRARS